MVECQNSKSAGKFYEHCWCDCGGYGPCIFSNSNSPISVGMYGVWKVNKFCCGCIKCWSVEFCISTE